MGADHHIHIRDHPRYRFAARCVCSACFERRSLNGARGKDRKQKYFTINVKKPLTAPSGSPRWRPSARCCTVSPATVWNTTRSRRKKNDNKKHGDSHAFLFTLPLVVKWFFAGNLLDKRERSGIISVPIVLVQLKRKNVKRGNIFRRGNVYTNMDKKRLLEK